MTHPFESHVRAASIGFALAALGTATAVHAQLTLHVDASAPSGGNGQSWAGALRDVQDALFFANLRPDRTQPVVIKIASGLYTPDAGTHDRNASFVLNSGISLLGGFAGRGAANPDENDPDRFVSVLSGDLLHDDSPGISTRTDNSKVVVSILNPPVAVSGVTIRGGVAALLQSGNGPTTLSRCRITDNNSSDLNNSLYYTIPAILNVRNATIEQCVISDNFSTQIPTAIVGNSIVRRSTFAGNSCVRTSAQSFQLFPLQLSASCTLDACLIAANVASDFGPIFQANFALFNCTIADNIAPSGAGGAIQFGSSGTLSNCVISQNFSSASAGDHQISISQSSFVSFVSCFLDHGAADIASDGGIIATTGLLSGSPGFANSAGPDNLPLNWHDNDYQLAPSSRCIDRGDTTSAFYAAGHSDILGHNLLDNPQTPNLGTGPIPYLDLGAYEYTPPACRADFNNSGSLSPQDIFDFLSAWFALNPAADFNASGTITAQDIFDFLGAWFSGC